MTFPKTAPSRKTGKYELHEADHLLHEDAGEDGRNCRGIGQEHGKHRRDRREEDDAEAAIGNEHQQHERADRDQKVHLPSPTLCPSPRLEFARAFSIGSRIRRHDEPVGLKLAYDVLFLRNDLLQDVTN